MLGRSVSLSVHFYLFCQYLKLRLFLLCVMFICTLSLGFCSTALDKEYVSTFFLATSRGWLFSGFSNLALHFSSWIVITALFVCLSIIRIALQLYD